MTLPGTSASFSFLMNPMKCAFGVSAKKFFGFLVHYRGINVDPAKATTIATMKRPTTVKELKSFLGRVSYIRRFVLGLASVTTGLSKLLKKGRSSLEEWNNKRPSKGFSRS